jgi:heme/copper-type cytochrome/quinol oxidase subunit 4
VHPRWETLNSPTTCLQARKWCGAAATQALDMHAFTHMNERSAHTFGPPCTHTRASAHGPVLRPPFSPKLAPCIPRVLAPNLDPSYHTQDENQQKVHVLAGKTHAYASVNVCMQVGCSYIYIYIYIYIYMYMHTHTSVRMCPSEALVVSDRMIFINKMSSTSLPNYARHFTGDSDATYLLSSSFCWAKRA